ncbi:GntR family transcriptional regulator [Amycolatopsis sp. lyj-90]|uniref:GntR family transcriptional regulator n=1 Tax=Amycolatopsis sp. lyj-90 TaxID=2789285 RepID=UPI00397A09D5
MADPARGGVPDDGDIPSYYRAKRHILALCKKLGEGVALPSERLLCDQLGVARATLRQGMLQLVIEGWVDSRQGSGSFVAKRPKVSQCLCLTNESAQDGLSGRTWITFERRPAGCELAHKLCIDQNDHVIHLECVRGSDGEVLAVESAFVPTKRFPRFSRPPAQNRSLHDELKNRFKMLFGGADQRMDIVHVSPREASLLGTLPALPGLVVHRTSWDARGEPFEWVRTLYRGDRLTLVNRVGSIERGFANERHDLR